MSDYVSMWKDLGMDLESHDLLCQVLPTAVGDVFLTQENRPKGMDFWDLVISEVHGIRPKELIEEQKKGRKVFGTFCVYVPDEVILAANGIVTGLCGGSQFWVPGGEAVLPKSTCPLIKASVGARLGRTCPFFRIADMYVGETTCDGKKKMFELMNDIKETYVLQLPSARDENALDAWEKEIIRFWKKLEDFYGITITEEDVKKAIELKNHERDVMLRFLELGKLDPAPLSGYEMGTRQDALGFNPDMAARCAIIEKRTGEVLKDWEANKKGKPSDRPRILVTGCPNAGVREKIIKAVEELGADVVAFDCCSGTREKIEKVDTTLPVTRALAKKYLNINCSVMSPNDARLDYISGMIDDYHVDGVLEIILQACHTYAIEATKVRRLVQEKGLPYLNIETDYSQNDRGQINTRLGAFLETINK